MNRRIGIVGLGHLGKIHLKCLQQTDFEISGVFDLDLARGKEVAAAFELEFAASYGALLDKSDVIDIVATTSSHFSLAKQALEKGKHVFIEKPFVEDIEEGKELLTLAKAKNCHVQLGHVERYNPAFQAIKNLEIKPKFIEVHRLAMFNPRGNDVSVVMDLMIHDLDLLCLLVDSEVDSIDANGVNVLENSPDICNARIKFKNGAVANLTASRISMKQMRKFRIFQNDKYVSVDLLAKECQVIKLSTENSANAMSFETTLGKKYITIESPAVETNNAILDELNDFYKSIKENTEVNVSLSDGLKSLKMAKMIQDSIFANNLKLIN